MSFFWTIFNLVKLFWTVNWVYLWVDNVESTLERFSDFQKASCIYRISSECFANFLGKSTLWKKKSQWSLAKFKWVQRHMHMKRMHIKLKFSDLPACWFGCFSKRSPLVFLDSRVFLERIQITCILHLFLLLCCISIQLISQSNWVKRNSVSSYVRFL